MSPSSVRLAKVPVAVISVVILVVLMPTGSAQLTCYSCKECDTYDPNQMVECVSDCSIWYSSDDEETTVHRGCLEEAEIDAIIYDQCGTDRCNTVQVARCARCASTATAQCANVICPTSADQCYLNPTDGHRGCTSDQNYEVDCTAGSNSCTTCTSEPDQPCNDIRMCVVCDVSKNPECLEDDALFVQQCSETTDRCYRYMDTELTLHLGCTSDEDYSINCRDAGNCRVCSSDECNREDKFECYICDDCTSVKVGLDSKIECNIVEDSRCYTGYDAITKQTHRGCFSESVPPYDVFDLCEDSACNDRIFPDHLQCYQCVGCDDVNGADLSYCSNSKASSCYMMLADTVGTKTLIRGCNTDEQYADCQIDRNCVTCERDQCNGESSQMTRFCDRCDGVEECEKQILTYNCGDRSFTNQCYLYSDGLGVLKKGCILELDPAMAEACYDPSDTRCTICKDIQCNRKHCVRCDTRTDGLVCVLGDKTVPALRYALCDGDVCRVEIDSEGHTVRGCLEDFLKPCAAGSCRETLLAGSNGGLFPANRRQCFQCEGDDCWMGQQAEDGQYCQLYRGSEDGCYIYNDGTTIVRGCTTDLGAKCVTGSDDPHCVVSFEDLKNDIAQQQAPITCYQDCSENVLSCVPVTCPAPSDRCFLSVSYSGVVTRGCTSSNCPSDSKDCFTCKEPNCNGVYSVCSSCDTMADIECTVGEEHGEICEQSIGCFQYQSVDRALYGCAEKAPEFCLNEEEHCKFCDQSFCNSKALSLCYSCTDCRNVLTPIAQKTQLCATESDHCITGLVGDRIDRGCRSDMPQPIEDYIVIEDCTDPTCNRAPITDWASCYACTDCAEVTTETAVLCLNPATNQCYTLRSANGVISRGCATETALFDCDDGINCAVCDYDNCNNLVVPREFSCVQCGRIESCADYNVLSNCPNQLGLVVDACVTHKADTGIMKGCMSSIELFVLCYGTTNNGRCNVTLESQSNARPVQCVDCKADAECVRGDLNELQTATYFHGSCVSFLDESGDVVRGNVVEYPECRDSSHCVECFHDGCNVGLFPQDRLLCYQCSGVECAQLANSALTPEPCLRYDAANAKCYTWYGSASSAQRGCLLDDDSICQMEGVSCQSCTESGCNDVQYDSFSDTKMCVKCSTNRVCDENPTEESCSTGGGCYTFYSELLVTAKGCVSELRESMAWYDECTAGTASERCERCFGDLCNRNKCYVCNSRDGPASNCIQPNLENTVSSTCIESEECVAFIDDNGHTVRGCSDSFEQDQIAKCSGSSGTCLRCMGDHCNGGALPKDRIKCYQCSGTIECLNPSKNSERYCDVYLEGENSCYTYFQDETTVERGCTLQRAEPCDQHCQKCNITGCNDQPAFVQNSLTCAQCLGDDCPAIDASEAAIAKPCPAEILFGRTEQCYSYFHPNGTLERGCLSELTKNRPPIAAQCLDESDVRCKFCSDSGCNVRNVKCFVCNTNTYAGCADNLEEAKHNALLQTCGTGQCVSLVEETTTRKGCAEDFKVKCDSGNICHTFEGPKSNSAVYPTSRLQCFKCQGSTCDEVQSSARTAACQQYNLNDECYTYVSDGGETFRGCVSDPLETNPCIVHPDHCVRCDSKSGCNTEPSRRSNGLICAQCSRAIDCEQSTRFAQCTQPLLLGRQDSCYVHSFAGEILARGCLSDAAVSLRDKCANAGNSECSLCRCDRCNGPPVRCVACEGETGCGDTLKTSENELVPCQTASCVSFVEHFANGSSLIVKGCSELYESDTCSKGHATDGTYQLCHSSGCNDVLFPVSRLKCYQCEGESCSDLSLEPTICEPYREGEMCYSYMNRPKKGCVGQLRDGDECEQDAGRCGVCDSTDGCNVEPRALECISCSSKTNPSCVDPMTRVLDKKICPIGGCATIIDDDGYTVRDCAAEFDASSELCSGPDGTCEVCTEGDSCNGALFPSNRLQCYQCSGANCLDVTQQTPSVCQLYNSTNDACYTYAVSPTNIRRGCLSDAISECPDKCVTCASGDGCNDLPPIVANTLTCLHCEGSDCAKLQHTDQGTVCPDILLGHIDACYTFVEQYTVRRGCLSEDTACNPADANCHVCADENDCNVDEYAVTLHECVLCDESVLGERCKWGYEQSTAQRCHPSDASFVQVGCYTCYATLEQTIGNNTLLTSVFHRGCVGEERQVECQPDTVQVCLGAGCNQRNEQLQICAKCMENGCDGDQWSVEECRGIVPYDRRGCYVMRDVRNRIYARGCLAELSADTRKLCSSAKDASCRTCFGNECNHAAVGLERVPFLWTLLLALLLALCSTR
ncbi:extracellular matrix protein A-like [Anopheles moucheti]|uniref:extracellular matrix protein A-like n=1 Tax=Anopheles moucheti TaxID=186751 RepID=UPI0022F0A738|nr:extracellular matrix protein A-like [Anopheles moucheti]